MRYERPYIWKSSRFSAPCTVFPYSLTFFRERYVNVINELWRSRLKCLAAKNYLTLFGIVPVHVDYNLKPNGDAALRQLLHCGIRQNSCAFNFCVHLLFLAFRRPYQPLFQGLFSSRPGEVAAILFEILERISLKRTRTWDETDDIFILFHSIEFWRPCIENQLETTHHVAVIGPIWQPD